MVITIGAVGYRIGELIAGGVARRTTGIAGVETIVLVQIDFSCRFILRAYH